MAAIAESELIARFERKKAEIIEQLLGKEDKYPIPDPVETRLTDKNWTSGKSWYTEKRVLKNANPSAFDPWLHEYNIQMHTNNGRIVTIDDTPLEAEVGAPIK